MNSQIKPPAPAPSPHTQGKLRLSEDPAERPLLGFVSRANAAKWADVLRGDPCSYCGQCDDTMTVDHIHPYSRRQKRRLSRTQHLATNGAGACACCNEAKADKDLLRYLCEYPIGRRPAELVEIRWLSGPNTPRDLFRRARADQPKRAWWQALFAQLASQPPSSSVQHDGLAFGIWHVALELGGRARTLEVKAALQPKVVIVRRVRWR